jgi:4-hydroxy-tetrahydrodipicolinate synthase
MIINELKEKLKGVSIVQITPFNDDESLDLEGLKKNTSWLVNQVKGKDFIITPLGSTGEFYAMSFEEWKSALKAVVEEANGQAIVMAGAASSGTRETIKMCQYAQSVGANGAQVVLPYYHVPSEEGMFLHYKKIAESVDPDFGIIVYNNPGVSGSWIKPVLMKKLSKIPNIIAVKENTLEITQIYADQKEIDEDDMNILIGRGEIVYSYAQIFNCKGFVSSTANFAPNLSYSIYEAALQKDICKLAEAVKKISPFLDFRKKVNANHGPDTSASPVSSGDHMYLSVVKAAMDMVGLRGGNVRLPMVNMNNDEKEELRSILKNMKLIEK